MQGKLQGTGRGVSNSRSPEADSGQVFRHQANNQLGVILAQCEILLEALRDRPAETARVRSIMEVVRRMERLVNDFVRNPSS